MTILLVTPWLDEDKVQRESFETHEIQTSNGNQIGGGFTDVAVQDAKVRNKAQLQTHHASSSIVITIGIHTPFAE